MLQTPSTTLSQPKVLHLHIVNNAIYINNIKVVSQHSVARLDIMHVLLAQFWQDFRNGLPAEKYKFLNINQLAEHLGFNPEIHNLEHKIRKPLNRMIKAIKENLFEELGLDCNDVIESIGWPGYSNKEYGYRLNPFILSLGATKPQSKQFCFYRINLRVVFSALAPSTLKEGYIEVTAFDNSNVIRERGQSI